jgi:hypothetical protein
LRAGSVSAVPVISVFTYGTASVERSSPPCHMTCCRLVTPLARLTASQRQLNGAGGARHKSKPTYAGASSGATIKHTTNGILTPAPHKAR